MGYAATSDSERPRVGRRPRAGGGGSECGHGPGTGRFAAGAGAAGGHQTPPAEPLGASWRCCSLTVLFLYPRSALLTGGILVTGVPMMFWWPASAAGFFSVFMTSFWSLAGEPRLPYPPAAQRAGPIGPRGGLQQLAALRFAEEAPPACREAGVAGCPLSARGPLRLSSCCPGRMMLHRTPCRDIYSLELDRILGDGATTRTSFSQHLRRWRLS